MNEKDKENVKIAGSGTVSGGIYESVSVAGSGTIKGQNCSGRKSKNWRRM